eukprot:TRINITY_DN11449_c0_g1_i1.p1 TRINITY_DN11449_c0_g1~~TRINITY_DN11449_c0_g1_i1.p1  ORF type:complete len:333 (-),score=41.03 TRINITY_DN11449_c0_g1_i1:319-1191(-)
MRSRSRSHNRSRSRSHSHRRSHREKHRHHRSPSHERHHRSPSHDIEPQVGQVCQGVVNHVEPYGVFLSLTNFKKQRNGLLHVSQFTKPPYHRRDARDMFQVGDKIEVIISEFKKNRISLTIPEGPLNIIHPYDEDEKDNLENKINPTMPKKIKTEEIGKMTGIKIDTGVTENSKKKITNAQLWEYSKMQQAQVTELEDDPNYNAKTGKLEYDEFEEEEPDVELNEREAPFLAGQTIRSGIAVSPIKISRAMEGTLQREIYNQIELMKKRKEKKRRRVAQHARTELCSQYS